MKSNRAMLAIGSALAIAAASAMAAPAIGAEEAESDHRRAHHRPSGNVPVPGGGAKERARRLARMLPDPTEGE